MQKVQQHAEREILAPLSLCDSKGNLNPAAINFSQKPIIDSNLSCNLKNKKKKERINITSIKKHNILTKEHITT